MAIGHTGEDRSAGGPVACALASAERAAQADRWDQLGQRAMIQRTQTGRGIRVSYRNDLGIEDSLRQLAAVENECCAWAAWIVEKHDEELVLVVTSPTEEGIAALHGMLTGL
jgi:hypothetical protein